MAATEPEVPQWLSTTAGLGRDSGVVLLRASAVSLPGLPDRLQLGAGHPNVLTAGRHKRNDAVLDSRSASKTQCQFALRRFRLPGQEEAHVALFLRDASKNSTLVNGTPAFRPWHWLQDEDVVGLPQDTAKVVGTGGPLEVFRVQYLELRKLPASLVSIGGLPCTEELGLKEELETQCESFSRRAGPARPREASAPVEALPRQQGRRKGDTPKLPFGEEVCGRVVDVTYADPPATYRMRVKSFEKAQGWHICDSAGLSVWDGESFTDEIFLGQFFSEGRLRFIGPEELEKTRLPKRQRRQS